MGKERDAERAGCLGVTCHRRRATVRSTEAKVKTHTVARHCQSTSRDKRHAIVDDASSSNSVACLLLRIQDSQDLFWNADAQANHSSGQRIPPHRLLHYTVSQRVSPQPTQPPSVSSSSPGRVLLRHPLSSECVCVCVYVGRVAVAVTAPVAVTMIDISLLFHLSF